MRRTKRRKKFAWFPILGAANVNEQPDDLNGRTFGIPFDGSGNSVPLIFPLLPDVQQEVEQIQPDLPGQLVEALGQDYVIERIVGKFFVAATGPADDVETLFPKIVQVSAGLFVARQADDNAGGGPNLPIGAASALEASENYSPNTDDNVRRPWMWRRDWILSTGRPNQNIAAAPNPWAPVVTNVGIGGLIAFQQAPATSNIQYGSVLDGPHVDIKSVRRVRSDERLWCAVAVRALDRYFNFPSPTVGAVSEVNGLVTLRVLGALRKTVNRSNF